MSETSSKVKFATDQIISSIKSEFKNLGIGLDPSLEKRLRTKTEWVIKSYFDQPLCKKCKDPLEKHYIDPAFVPKGKTFCIFEPEDNI